MRRWKRDAVSAFLHEAGLDSRYFSSLTQAISAARQGNGCIVIWASKADAAIRRQCEDVGIKLYLMEDGFLRSRGLGAHRVQPLSLVIDTRGIYYDPRGPSDLEVLLQEGEFSAQDLAQAEELRQQIVAGGLSKYNVGERYALGEIPAGRRIVLVPGQVADDASLRYGAGNIGSNLELLKAVRAGAPDAFIIYKPHPDVEMGRRSGFLSSTTVLRHADFIATGMASDAAIAVADEIATMTSLLGFEALLRGKAVTCYGMPFYAGWGVTRDHLICPRRTRSRSVTEILAAAYLKYARYLDPVTHKSISAAQVAALISG